MAVVQVLDATNGRVVSLTEAQATAGFITYDMRSGRKVALSAMQAAPATTGRCFTTTASRTRRGGHGGFTPTPSITIPRPRRRPGSAGTARYFSTRPFSRSTRPRKSSGSGRASWATRNCGTTHSSLTAPSIAARALRTKGDERWNLNGATRSRRTRTRWLPIGPQSHEPRDTVGAARLYQ